MLHLFIVFKKRRRRMDES